VFVLGWLVVAVELLRVRMNQKMVEARVTAKRMLGQC